MVWTLVIQVPGLAAAHNTTIGRAIGAVAILIGCLLVLDAGLTGLSVLAVMSQLG